MKLKMPQLKKPEGGEKADSGASKFFSDLYRDLSDRHLLLPLIGLVIAIVAVPMLLSSSPEPTLPATAPATDTAGPTALDAAVVVSNPGIRDYKDRLAALKEKNPFAAAAGAGSSSGGNEGTTSSTTSGSGDSTGSTSSSTSGSTPTTPTTPPPSAGSSSSGSAPVDTGGTPTTPPPDTGTDPGTTPQDVKPETRFYASRIDVTVGPVGKAKEIDSVKQLDFLPDSKAPVVAYLGLVNNSSALFSVNPGVAETQGEGSCAPHGNACMYLTLKVGEEQRFVYGDADDAKIYRLKLLDARIVRVQDPRDRDAADNGADQKRAHAPLDASSRTN